jgi:hypothetical protein
VRRAVLGSVLATLLIAAPNASGQVVSGAISGRLVDGTTHAPVVGAEVYVLGLPRPEITDSNGGFLHRGLAPGTRLLQARRIGYVKTEWPIKVGEGEVVEVLLEVDPVPVVLTPEVIEGDASQLPTWFRGFEERRAIKRGQYVTREQIEQQNPSSTLGDVLRMVNGLAMRCNRQGCSIRMTRWSNCTPEYFQDGLPVYATTAERYFAFDIYGVEIYGLSDVPIEFQRPGLKCGVIALWTRRGPPPRK